MIEFVIVVREPGTIEADYSLAFKAPAVPQIGSYISITRPDRRDPLSEDLVVRHVWWRLRHNETHGFASTESPGELIEIFVECDQALGPYSHADWRARLEAARARGIAVEDFQVERMAIGLG